MRWSCWLAVIGLSVTQVASFAQRPPCDEGSDSACSTPRDDTFFSSGGHARFQLVRGRLRLDAPRHRKGTKERQGTGFAEKITVSAERGIPSLRYLLHAPSQRLTLNVEAATEVRIESLLNADSERSVLHQPEDGLITWSRQRGDLNDHYTGSTLLHVRNADRESFDRHYGPLIERLLRGQSLAALCREVESVMFASVHDEATPSRGAVRRCVDQLSSRERATRLVAQRQLLAWGTPIIPALSEIETGELDAEQEQRLKLVLRRLHIGGDDTPISLAKFLVNDQAYWSSIADQMQDDQLQFASERLTRLGFGSISSAAGSPKHRVASIPDVQETRRQADR